MIEELSLQNNSLTGAIDFGDGCPLVELSVDCDEVQCACCTLYCNSTIEPGDTPDLPTSGVPSGEPSISLLIFLVSLMIVVERSLGISLRREDLLRVSA